MTARFRKCSEEIVSGRLRKAEQFLEVAEMVRELADDEGDVGDALVTLCVHAPPVTADQRKRAWRRAERLVDAARLRRQS